jgi:hypothetical protein
VAAHPAGTIDKPHIITPRPAPANHLLIRISQLLLLRGIDPMPLL